VFGVDSDQRVGRGRRVPVGAQPSAVAVQPLDWASSVTDDFEYGTAVAVANRGSDSVSILVVGDKGAVERLQDVPVGRQPDALAWGDLNGDERLDLVVADRGSRDVVALMGRRHDFRSRPAVALPPAVGAGGLSLEIMGGGVVVGDPAATTIWQLPVDSHGALGPPVALRSVAAPAALAAGAFGGDDQLDVAFIDPTAGTVEPILQAGDRRVSATPLRAARNLAAADGRVMWSQRAVHDQRLMVSSGGAATELPVAGSRRPFRPRVGRARNGSQVATYVRCGRTRCRPYLWNIERAKEARLALPVHRGCAVTDVARWRDTTAYVTGAADRARCPRRARGLWVRKAHEPARRIARATSLGDIRRGALTWIDDGDPGNIHLATRRRAPRKIAVGDPDCCFLDNPIVRGRFVYWTLSGFGESTLVRARLRAPTACHALWPRDDERGLGYKAYPETADYSVDHGHVYYVNDFGVFEVQPTRITWSHDCRNF
jgi:hypothetical protein